jgi:mRNA interferase RelE/StbE
MTEYGITFARSARKELEALDAAVLGRVWSRIKLLTTEPRPAGCRKLQGHESLWRIRIGDYRVIYAVLDDTRIVDIIAVRHRSKAYQ